MCSACGRDWPHGLLYRTLSDLELHERGQCPWCAFGLPVETRVASTTPQQLSLFD